MESGRVRAWQTPVAVFSNIVPTRLTTALMGLVLGACSSPQAPTRDDRPIAAQADDPDSRATGDPLPERCKCPPAMGCEILGRHEVGSVAAIERGFAKFSVERGVVSCDPEAIDCGWREAPTTAMIVETSSACGLWGNFLMVDAAHVHVQVPQSIGVGGGPAWALATIGGADPASYEPLSQGFGRDTSHVYDHGEILEGADPSTFEVLQCADGCRACDAARCW
jgi:hypothetical protein